MALTKWQPPALRSADNGRVTWVELFFDLIYVAALIQLGDRLSSDVSWAGIGQFLGSFVILWWTWTGTTAFMNRFAVDDIVHRTLTFVQMFAVGNFAIIATTADVDRSRWLIVAYLAARLPLLAMYVRVRHRLPHVRAFTDLYLGVFTVSGAALVASLVVPAPVRYWIWAAALLVEFSAPIVSIKRSTAPPTHDEHFQERYALFTIIVLGETFVKTLSEITNAGVTLETQVFGAGAFIMLIALWWTYFDDVAESHIRPTSALARAKPKNRLIWVYVHLPLTASLTAFGVASKKIVGIEAFGDSFTDTYAWLLVGALVSALLSVAVLDAVTASPHFAIDQRTRVGSRLVAAAVLAPVGALMAGGQVNAAVGLSVVSIVVVAQIAIEVVVATRSERQLGRRLTDQLRVSGGSCEHLERAVLPAEAGRPSTCLTCDELGLTWVQLRLCVACGHVGCCDDSRGQHARAHHVDSGHVVIASLEPGDRWAHCYVDDVTDFNWLRSTEPERPS